MPARTSRRDNGSRRERILSYLSSQGGRVDSVDGRGLTSKMATKVGYDNIAALNAILTRLERDGEIKRVVRGKRTYSIALKGRGPRASRTASTRKARTPARKATGSGPASRASRTPRASARSAQSGGARRTRGGSGLGNNLPGLLAALGSELLALREENEAMSRRIAALEATTRRSSARGGGRRAA